MTGSLVDAYDRMAARWPDRPALTYDRQPHAGTVLTWRVVAARSHALAGRLGSAGVRRGGRCGLVMADHPDLVPALLAAWRAGAVVVPIDPQWGEGTRRTVVAHSRVDTVVDVVAGSCLPREPAAGPALPAGTAMISYTSGSTADPKGVVLTHAQLRHAYQAGGQALTDLLGHRPARFGVAMRMSGLGILGMNYLWPAVLGMDVVVLPELVLGSAPDYWARLRSWDVDVTYLVPPLVELLNRLAGDDAPPDARRAVTCLSGGAPLRTGAQERFQQRFGATLLNVYGLTEVSFAAFFGDRDATGAGTASIGRPATVRARLRGPDGQLVPGPGEGELELSGPAMSCGYYDNDAATAELIQDGWVRTGDLTRRDAAGRYLIVGRRKDVALKGAFTIYLHEVEEAAIAHPGVLEAAAVRLDLPTGEDIGLLVRGSALDPEEVLRDLRRRLGHQRAPRRVVVSADPIPRTGQEKIDRRAALARWQALTRGGRPADQKGL